LLAVKLTVSEVNANAGWLSAVKAGIYENIVEGRMYKLSDEDETPIKVFSGHVGRKIFVADAGKEKAKTLLVDCDELEMEKICFKPEGARPANSSLVIWKNVVAHIVKDDTGAADKEKTLVETQQREIRKAREAREEEFVPQYFKYSEEQECWIPLKTALDNVVVK
jgi:hypothetical protein